MPITTETYGKVVVTRLNDELTQDNVARFESALEQLEKDGIHQFVIDMEKTEYVDNAGLEAIDDLMMRLENSGGQVKFSGLGSTCRKIFEITRFDRRCDLFETLIDAVRSFH
jgi:anti-sigma B factor antagonist